MSANMSLAMRVEEERTVKDILEEEKNCADRNEEKQEAKGNG